MNDMNDIKVAFSVGQLFLRVFVQFLVLYWTKILLICEGRTLLGNMVEDCFYVELFLLLESVSLYVTLVGLSII